MMNAHQRRKQEREFSHSVTVVLQSWHERKQITEWLDTNRIFDWTSPSLNLWKFAKEQDAVLFKLRWL